MIDSAAADVANRERFVRIGLVADAHSAARIREEFTHWLEQYFDVDATRTNDLVLATNEALANVAEFAYVTVAQPGTMDVLAHYDADDCRLTVTISDHGMWRPKDPAPKDRLRGRGIPLMHALSDHASIDPTPAGTQVRLEWTGVRYRPEAVQQAGG